jgi:DNA-binding MarR family transcriptional regulator
LSEPDRADSLHRLLKLHNRLMAPFSTHLEHRHKISINEFRLLMTIGRLGSTASHELAALTGVNAMSVSRAVTALEKHGRIQVEVDPANRRRKTITLTLEGRRLYQAMLPTTERVVEYLFSALTPEQIAAFDTTVATLTDALEAQDGEGRSLFLENTRPGRG